MAAVVNNRAIILLCKFGAPVAFWWKPKPGSIVSKEMSAQNHKNGVERGLVGYVVVPANSVLIMTGYFQQQMVHGTVPRRGVGEMVAEWDNTF